MKLILAGDTALYGPTDYKYFLYNCNLNKCQHPYSVPIPDLNKLQFFVYFGAVKPATMEFKIVSTCGNLCSYYEVTNDNPDEGVMPFQTCTGYFVASHFDPDQTRILYARTGSVFPQAGFIITDLGNSENVIAQDYVVGQLPNGLWYGVFKNFTTPVSLVPSCFVVSAMFTFGAEEDPDYSELRYFSEEICIENCGELMEIKACFPDKATTLGFDMNRIYYGYHNGDPVDALGDIAVRYFHKYYVRQSYIVNTGKKTTFKNNAISRNFRTVIELLYQIRTELVPEWYSNYLMAAFARGEITVRETMSLAAKKWLLSETNFELIDDDAKLWKPVVTLLETIKQFFGCDECINGEAICKGNPVNVLIGHIGPVYVFTFAGAGALEAGESIQYEVREKVSGVLIKSGQLDAEPLTFTIPQVQYNPDDTCYTVRWRKVCATDEGSFSVDYSDDFEVGGAAGAFSEWLTKENGNCVTTPAENVCKRYQVAVFGSDGDTWSIEATLCDGSSYAASGLLVGDGNPPPICAREGSVSVGGNATVADSSEDCDGGCFTYKIEMAFEGSEGYSFTQCNGDPGGGIVNNGDVIFVCAQLGSVVTSAATVTRQDPCAG